MVISAGRRRCGVQWPNARDRQETNEGFQIMRNVLPAACAAMLVTLAASACFAGDGRYYDNYGGYNYYDNDYRNYEGYGYNRGYSYDYIGGYQYRQDVVSPRSIVRSLRHQRFSYISWPTLAGRFYQVKARDPNGHKVKLYIDAF